jgi:hypothetical protein
MRKITARSVIKAIRRTLSPQRWQRSGSTSKMRAISRAQARALVGAAVGPAMGRSVVGSPNCRRMAAGSSSGAAGAPTIDGVGAAVAGPAAADPGADADVALDPVDPVDPANPGASDATATAIACPAGAATCARKAACGANTPW